MRVKPLFGGGGIAIEEIMESRKRAWKPDVSQIGNTFAFFPKPGKIKPRQCFLVKNKQ